MLNMARVACNLDPQNSTAKLGYCWAHAN